jgi:hypothetical protein
MATIQNIIQTIKTFKQTPEWTEMKGKPAEKCKYMDLLLQEIANDLSSGDDNTEIQTLQEENQTLKEEIEALKSQLPKPKPPKTHTGTYLELCDILGKEKVAKYFTPDMYMEMAQDPTKQFTIEETTKKQTKQKSKKDENTNHNKTTGSQGFCITIVSKLLKWNNKTEEIYDRVIFDMKCPHMVIGNWIFKDERFSPYLDIKKKREEYTEDYKEIVECIDAGIRTYLMEEMSVEYESTIVWDRFYNIFHPKYKTSTENVETLKNIYEMYN